MIDFNRTSRRLRFQLNEVLKSTRRLNREVRALASVDGNLVVNLARGYNVLVMRNIASGRYPDKNVAPSDYNPRYLQWKQENYGHTEPWHLTGEGVQRIRVFKDGRVRKVGIPRGLFDRGGKSWLNENGSRKYGRPREITWYMAKLEAGDPANNQPPRPVFAPTLEDFVEGENMEIIRRFTTPVFRRWEVL